MDQLSFYSAEAQQPRISDLAGVLCGPGQAVGFGRGTAARISVVVAEPWRAHALAAACADRGVAAEISTSDSGLPLVRTAFRSDLTALAGQWLRGAVKSVPADLTPNGGVLRVWALSAGRLEPGGYVLGLDPHAPDTHAALVSALGRAGLPAKVIGPRGGGPALRVTGRRRIARLAELVGPTPVGAIERTWPLVS